MHGRVTPCTSPRCSAWCAAPGTSSTCSTSCTATGSRCASPHPRRRVLRYGPHRPPPAHRRGGETRIARPPRRGRAREGSGLRPALRWALRCWPPGEVRSAAAAGPELSGTARRPPVVSRRSRERYGKDQQSRSVDRPQNVCENLSSGGTGSLASVAPGCGWWRRLISGLRAQESSTAAMASISTSWSS